jgi:exonuclease III
MSTLRIATFNVENLEEAPPTKRPLLAERIALMKPQIVRLRADVACLQEVNSIGALRELLAGTNLEDAHIAHTQQPDGSPLAFQNVVVVSRLPILARHQLKNKLVEAPAYKRLTAIPPDSAPISVAPERPILHVELDLGDGRRLHVISMHLKSKIPMDIPGQVIEDDKKRTFWRSADAWAEGAFLSSMKRMGQALEVRRRVDQILNEDLGARIIVAGDFNATPDEVPVLAIRGNVEDTGNTALSNRVMVPIEQTIPESSRYTLFHHGKGQMIDHMLVTRNLLAAYRGSEIHNEILHDESLAFADDPKFPDSDHAPVVATFELG